MKVQPRDIESFIKSPPSHIRAILIYGPDNGLVLEREKKLATIWSQENQDDPFSMVEMSFEKFKEDPTMLADEMAAISLMGGRKIIRVQSVPAAMAKEMKSTLQEPPGDGVVIVTAGDLTPKSSLRLFFEKEEHTAAIPCYKDEKQTVKRIIETLLKEHNKQCDSQALQYMQHYIMGDRMIIHREIEKLLTYCGDNTHITLQDVLACVSNNNESSLDELCNAIASGNSLATEKLMMIMEQEGTNIHMMLRSLQRYFIRLHLAKSYIAKGMSEQEAMKQLRPPVFFKQAEPFKKNLRANSLAKIDKILAILVKAEQSTKRNYAASDIINKQAVNVLTRVLAN